MNFKKKSKFLKPFFTCAVNQYYIKKYYFIPVDYNLKNRYKFVNQIFICIFPHFGCTLNLEE